jgi:hypothetical protein
MFHGLEVLFLLKVAVKFGNEYVFYHYDVKYDKKVALKDYINKECFKSFGTSEAFINCQI